MWYRFTFLSLVVVLVCLSSASSQEPPRYRALRPRKMVRGFVLMDPRTNKPMRRAGRIRNRAVIDLSRIGTQEVNIRANASRRKTTHVEFTFNGSPLPEADTTFPFSLAGDTNGQYHSMTLTPGEYQLSALGIPVPPRSIVAQMRPNIPHEIQFRVIDSMGMFGGPNGPSNNTTGQAPGQIPGEVIPAPVPPPNAPGIPGLSTWMDQMRTFGNLHCNRRTLNQLGTWEGSIWYYDGLRVYQQIAQYTGENSWNNCANFVRDVYRTYVLNSNGRVPGWRVFPHGLYLDHLRTGSTRSRNAIRLLAQNSAFADQGGGASHELSRETAYLIHAYMIAEQIGEPRHPKFAAAIEYALGHVDQWTGTESADYVQPFMVGLTLEALISYYHRHGDNRVPQAVQQAVDWLWAHAWRPANATFDYILCKPGANPSDDDCNADHSAYQADLNLLIAPAFAWTYAMTGEQRYQQRGDAIFLSGVQRAWLEGGKQFSQSYRWSFDYLRWRKSN